MRTSLLALLGSLLFACQSKGTDGDTDSAPGGDSTQAGVVDADGDGAPTDQDCDDSDAALNLDDSDGDGASTCDGDCDDSDPQRSISDSDGDGVTSCDDDCDDDNSAAYPGAASAEPELCTIDSDGDGYGDDQLGAPYQSGTDCDDGDGSSHPGAEEVWYDGVDQDCLGDSDFDADQDGFDSDAHDGTDCDDTDALVNPDAEDSLLGGDRNCDGAASDSLSLADYTFTGDGGTLVVASAGDVDGDGVSDILIGQDPSGSSSTGMVHLFLASSLSTTRELSLSMADYTLVGVTSGGYGIDVASAGDVDGDGLDDIIIGDEGAGGKLSGEAYIVLASTILKSGPSMNLSDADYRFLAEGDWEQAGHVVTSAGDVDGDGLADVIVGADYGGGGWGYSTGRMYLFLGSSLGDTRNIELRDADYRFLEDSNGDFGGRHVAGVGDMDGDGLDDILIGASGNEDGGQYAGKAVLFLAGSLGSRQDLSHSEADYSFLGTGVFAGLGVASPGDVDGDGVPDILIGAYEVGSALVGYGGAYLVRASSLGTAATFDLSNADYIFEGYNEGASNSGRNKLSGIGDIDGDGLDDFIIPMQSCTAETGEGASGQVYLFRGSSLGKTSNISLTDADIHLSGRDGVFALGHSVSGAGDVNGDGLDDVLIGSSKAVFLLFGSR